MGTLYKYLLKKRKMYVWKEIVAFDERDLSNPWGFSCVFYLWIVAKFVPTYRIPSRFRNLQPVYWVLPLSCRIAFSQILTYNSTLHLFSPTASSACRHSWPGPCCRVWTEMCPSGFERYVKLKIFFKVRMVFDTWCKLQGSFCNFPWINDLAI